VCFPPVAGFKAITMQEWQSLVKTGGYYWTGEGNNQQIEYQFDSLVPKKEHIFKDYYFEMDIPFTKRELEELQLSNGVMHANAEINYKNYYKNYEQAVGFTADNQYDEVNNTSHERGLPHYYSFLNEMKKSKSIFHMGSTMTDIQGYNAFREKIHSNPGQSNMTIVNQITYDDAFNALVSPPPGLGYMAYDTPGYDTVQSKQFLSYRYFNELWASEYKKVSLGEYDNLVYLENEDQQNPNYPQLFDILKNKYNNILFPAENISVLQEEDDKQKLFPYNINIEFNTSKTNQIADLMAEAKLSSPFMRKIAQANMYDFDGNTLDSIWNFNGVGGYLYGNEQDIGDSESDLAKVNRKSRWKTKAMIQAGATTQADDVSLGTKKILGETEFKQSDMKIMPVRRFLHSYIKSGNKLFNPSALDQIVIANGSDSSEIQGDGFNQIINMMLTFVFSSKYETLVKKHTRNFEEILAGKPCYNETIVYRIAKMARRAGTNEPFETIQNIYLPNTSKLEIAKYIDTQVKYGQGSVYKYIVYAYQVVFGNSYAYDWDVPVNYNITSEVYQAQTSGLTEFDDHTMRAEFNVFTWPDPVLVEVPFWESQEIYMLDRPPVFPDVNIIPYRAVNSEILINLNVGQGRYKDIPVSLTPSDSLSFQKIKLSQGAYEEDQLIEFASDDQTLDSYEIFRIENYPVEYSDFGSPYQVITQTSFKDKLKPNKKYWYLFRSRDVHGHISNPSPIYQVELYDDGGAVKPIIKTVELEIKIKKHIHKSGKKYIHIIPTNRQIEDLDYEIPVDENLDPLFVNQDQTAKKFKIRLTSRKTGKKIDFNLQFKKKETILDEDEVPTSLIKVLQETAKDFSNLGLIMPPGTGDSNY
jgi:hypothetical protein